MKFGVTLFATDEGIWPSALGKAVEERGFDSIWLAEHSHIPASRETPFPLGGELPREYYRAYDPFVALASISSVTERILLGTAITLIIQRDPIHTAKAVATLDQVSGGRAVLGVGVGWNLEEMRNHGTDPSVRGRLADERLAAIREIWTKEQAEFHGTLVDFDQIYSWPKPVRQPHPPIYVGGNSAAAVARAIRHDAGWLPFAVPEPRLVDQQLAMAERAGGGDSTPITITSFDPSKRAVLSAYMESRVERILFLLPEGRESETLHRPDGLAGLIESMQ
ncbi:LLM class F420-dependent oxidoreductase [Pseudonocardia alaniniphila]|uniref:LLM class F420-dependent oxidoreductase n=1 Tax=Pseudonocardia alaniniphila TaxID=75291 RepID=A0ABS9TQ35_9PSEU|nr:LLM class F420-dependent oxidoreductase [Pseudonocardia alaniniphila]MCH6170657.1 LLM class F420-dependent oxidoreductase [Pseudonocardia alaniniphila]